MTISRHTQVFGLGVVVYVSQPLAGYRTFTSPTQVINHYTRVFTPGEHRLY